VARTLILSAWEPEIAPLRRLDLSGPALDALALAVGVGPVEAAVGAARAIAAHGPRRVIFVGTTSLSPEPRHPRHRTAALAGDLTCVSTPRGNDYRPKPSGPGPAARWRLAQACGRSGIVSWPAGHPIGHPRTTSPATEPDQPQAFAVRARRRRGPSSHVLVANRVRPRATGSGAHLAASDAAR
jgi:hypothetical protein